MRSCTLRPSARAGVSVLFSEPKIPQYEHPQRRCSRQRSFQCSSASRKFLNPSNCTTNPASSSSFSALQRAENSSILPIHPRAVFGSGVSVLFSEPKIPQSRALLRRALADRGFSALQRAENSSIIPATRAQARLRAFQCSSASRKFLNRSAPSPFRRCERSFQCSSASRKFLNGALAAATVIILSFSALQRAENSSISGVLERVAQNVRFQCSSASRKFLNTFLE